jgi:hypothetical protein
MLWTPCDYGSVRFAGDFPVASAELAPPGYGDLVMGRGAMAPANALATPKMTTECARSGEAMDGESVAPDHSCALHTASKQSAETVTRRVPPCTASDPAS